MPTKYTQLTLAVRKNVAEGKKTLVWTNFIGNIKLLERQILALFEPAVIYGGVPSGDEDAEFRTRESELRRFRTDPACQVLIANPMAMSEGVAFIRSARMRSTSIAHSTQGSTCRH